jgi:hypothetical protein
MVEQWTENPCVPGSIPGGTTKPTQTSGFFVFRIRLSVISLRSERAISIKSKLKL